MPAAGRDTGERAGVCFGSFCILKKLETEKMIGNGPLNPAKNLFVPSYLNGFVIYHKMQLKNMVCLVPLLRDLLYWFE
jgi:hypothetical protein